MLEVNRPDRAKRRLKGKSDPIDAENVARSVMAENATAIPKNQSGAVEAMRIISVARRNAVKAKTQAINQLRAVLVSAPQDIRERLWKAKPEQCVAGLVQLESLGSTVFLEMLTETLRLNRRLTVLPPRNPDRQPRWLNQSRSSPLPNNNCPLRQDHACSGS